MIEKILEWGGLVFVVVGLICLFWEAFACLRRKSNTVLTLIGMVLLSLSVIGYLITEIIMREKEVPIVFPIIWIALLWAYLICNFISAIRIARKNRKQHKMQQSSEDDIEDNMSTDDK